jgi:dihydroneopterin aldolase
MDTIFIQKLKVDAIIGVYKHERNTKQAIYIDLELQYDCQQASVSDNLKYALDYHKLCNDIQAFVSGSCFQLIEALADSIADNILKNKLILQLKLTLSKPEALDQAQNVGIIIHRKNDQ